MYSTKFRNRLLTIQRKRRLLLGVWDENWRFADEHSELLNELEDGPKLLLREGRKGLKEIDGAFGRKVQHA